MCTWPNLARGTTQGRLWEPARARPQPGELCAGWSQLVASQRTSGTLIGAGLLGGRGWVRCGFWGVGGGRVRGAGGGCGEERSEGVKGVEEQEHACDL